MSLDNAFVLGAEGPALGSDRACERLATVIMRLVGTGKRVVLFAGPTPDRAMDLAREASRLPVADDGWQRAEVLARGAFESARRLSWWLEELGVPSVVLDDVRSLPLTRGGPLEAEPRLVSAPKIAASFAEAPVVILPGGVGHGGAGRISSLGTGGAALSAVFTGDRLALPVRVLGVAGGADVDDVEQVASGGLPRRAALLARDSRVSVFAASDASALLPPDSSSGRAPAFAVRASTVIRVPA